MSFLDSSSLKNRPATRRALAVAGLAALSLLPVCLSGPEAAREAVDDQAARRFLENWRFGKIGEAPAATSAAGRYRLRLSIRLRPASLTASNRDTQDMQDSQRQPPRPSCPPMLDVVNTPSPEFRLLLERTGEGDFTCLRCLDGRLELVRFAGGELVRPSGKSRTVAPFLTELPRPGAKPVTLEFSVDRSPGRWTVGLFGEEILAVPELRPSAGEFAWSATPEWKLESRSVQPVAGIAFDDAFERAKFRETGGYELLSGEWRLDSVRDVKRTVNAFRLRGKGKPASPALAAVGHDFWRDYRFEASLKFPGPGTGGLVFAARSGRRRGPDDAARPGRKLGLVRWTCPPPDGSSPRGKKDRGKEDTAKDNRAGGAPPADLLQVLMVERFTPPERAKPPSAEHVNKEHVNREHVSREHVRRVLVSLPWRPRPDQWYRVAISIFDETGELDVNGRRVAFRLPAGLRSGKCGLYSESSGGVLFDDLSVRSNTGFVYTRGDLVAPLAERPDGWARIVGLPDGPVRLRVRPGRGARRLSLRWADNRANDVLLALTGGLESGELRLEPAGGGESVGLGGFHCPVDLLRREVTVEITDDLCTVLDGASMIARTKLPGRRAGPVRIALAGGRGRLSPGQGPDYLAAGPLAPPAPIRGKSRAFEKVDVSVNSKGQKFPKTRYGGFIGWIEDRGAWDVAKGAVRFRAPVWGEVDAEFDPGRLEQAGTGPVGLYFLPDRGAKGFLGVSLVRESDCIAVVDPYGEVLCRRYDGDEIGSIRLRRVASLNGSSNGSLNGGWVEALVELGSGGGEVVYRASLDDRIAVRVEARAPGVRPKDVTIRAPSVDESLFEGSPTEWIRWRGHWDLTSKWQCDPRWSFLGIWSDAIDTKREAAGLFSRASYFGNQYLHINFAFKDTLGGKNKRRYVRRDLNFAFCCEGEDLASGYCLLFGGFDNRGTQLMRRGELVAENKKLHFPRFTGGIGDIHWAWYSLEITRREGEISVVMNGKDVLKWTDPEPLEGGRVGVWVLGGGMILGRTRFSAARRGPGSAGVETVRRAAPPFNWRPMDSDRPAAIEETPLGVVRVTNRAGGGHFAAEVRLSARGGTPRPKAFAFRASPLTRVSARLYSRGKKEPAARLPGKDNKKEKTLPADGEWHVFALDASSGSAKGELDRMRLGMWEPEGYLAAGIGGNPSGAWYEVKLFPTPGAATRFCRWGASEDPF